LLRFFERLLDRLFERFLLRFFDRLFDMLLERLFDMLLDRLFDMLLERLFDRPGPVVMPFDRLGPLAGDLLAMMAFLAAARLLINDFFSTAMCVMLLQK
jgi:hypothetical protein